MSKHPVPTGKERSFEFNELFFSTTDRRGIIQFGNEVFVRISGYEKERLIGAPHNIIRHPDMPRAVFKLLWDTLHQGKMIAAYVKNLAINGDHYWVLAMVFPIGDQYLSIRLKPTSALFEAAKQIYAKALPYERANGMESTQQLLLSSLQEAGFKNYEAFMTAALMAELKARDGVLISNSASTFSSSFVSRQARGSTAKALQQISIVAKKSTDTYRALFGKIGEFGQASEVFREKTHFLLGTFDQFQLLSLNMRIFAARIGEAGASLGVVSENFQNLVREIEQYLIGFADAVGGVIEDMHAATLQSATLKAQMDMVDFFVRESLEATLKPGASIEEAFEGLRANSEQFKELSSTSSKQAEEKIQKLRKSIHSFDQANREIKRFVNGIELIRQMAAVEAARLKDPQQDFGHYLQRMREFSEVLRSSIQDIGNSTQILTDSIVEIERSLQEVSGSLPEIFRLALSLNQSDGSGSPQVGSVRSKRVA